MFKKFPIIFEENYSLSSKAVIITHYLSQQSKFGENISITLDNFIKNLSPELEHII